MFWMNTTTKYQEVLYSRTLNKYKRIFHHIDFKEAKSKHLDDLAVKKLEEERKVKQEKEISKIVEEKKYSWRDTITEAEWVALDTGGIANKTTQTFGLTDFGMPVMGPDFNQVTANFGGLGGVDVHPSEFAYNGAEGESQTTPPPTYNQLALAGFTKPLPMFRRQGEANAKEINSRLQASQDFAQATGSDAYMNARLEYDKQFEEEMEEWRKEKEQMDLEYKKKKEEVRVYNEKIMFQHHKTISGMTWDSKRKMGIPDIDPDSAPPGSDLDISNRLNAKYWIPGKDGGRGVMTITDQEWAKLHCEMGGCANEAKRKELEKKIKPDPLPPMHKDLAPDDYQGPIYPTAPSTLPFYKWFKEWGKPIDPENIAEPENKRHEIGIDTIPYWGAKAVFDYYMKFLNGDKDNWNEMQDLTNLIPESDLEWLRNLLDRHEYVLDAETEYQSLLNKGIDDSGLGVMPLSIRNTLGNLDAKEGSGFYQDADFYYFKKKYDFSSEKDMGNIIPKAYAKKMGLMKWFGKAPDGVQTPAMHFVIKIPKKKKKEEFWSTP